MLREGLGFSRVIIRVGKTDLRRGIDCLASIIRLEYGLEPMEAGTMFLFCDTKRDRIKGLLYEGDGFLLLIKRLTDGVFQWPRNSNEAMELSQDEFNRLMEGFTVVSSIRTFKQFVSPTGTSGGS